MAISEIPAKMIEKTESYNEAQLNTATELTKLFYSSSAPKIISEEEIFRTFINNYNKIKQISPPPIMPPPLDKINWRKKSILIPVIFIFIIILGMLSYSIFFLHLGFNLKEFLGKVT